MDSGLEGVIAAETVLSHSDGERGILRVRGHTLPELITRRGYEGAVALLWERFAGDGLGRARMRAELGSARHSAFAVLGEWLDAAVGRLLTEGVRSSLAFFVRGQQAHGDPGVFAGGDRRVGANAAGRGARCSGCQSRHRR
jgi:citrate synthase